MRSLRRHRRSVTSQPASLPVGRAVDLVLSGTGLAAIMDLRDRVERRLSDQRDDEKAQRNDAS